MPPESGASPRDCKRSFDVATLWRHPSACSSRGQGAGETAGGGRQALEFVGAPFKTAAMAVAPVQGWRSAPGIGCQSVWVAHMAQIAIARR
jgi:hypothetical protein